MRVVVASELLDVRDMMSLVSTEDGPLGAWVLQALSHRGAGEPLHVFAQAANLTSSIFEMKYGFARERGFEVLGLEPLVSRLGTLDDRIVKACTLTTEEHAGVVVCDESLSEVLGILKVSRQVDSR